MPKPVRAEMVQVRRRRGPGILVQVAVFRTGRQRQRGGGRASLRCARPRVRGGGLGLGHGETQRRGAEPQPPSGRGPAFRKEQSLRCSGFLRTRVIRVDVEDALRAHGGAENIRSAKRYAPHNRRLKFAMDWTLPAFEPPPEVARYGLTIDLQDAPRIEEKLKHNASLVHRPADELRIATGLADGPARMLPPSRSALFLFPSHPLARLLSHVTLYRIDPRSEPGRHQ